MELGVIIAALIGGILIAGVIFVISIALGWVTMIDFAMLTNKITSSFDATIDGITEFVNNLTIWFTESGEAIVEFFSELFSFLG